MATKKVTVGAEMVNASKFECSRCDFKTNDMNKQVAHLKEHPHRMVSGNFPCKICGKTVTIVPDYVDKPAPDSGLPSNNTQEVHKKFTMVSKKPSFGRVSGGLGTCDDCKKELKRELDE